MNQEQLKQLEADLRAAVDNLRANTDLKSSGAEQAMILGS